VVLRDVVDVAHRRLDVGVAHPRLHVGEREPLHRERPERVALRTRVFAAYGRRCRDCGRSDVPLEIHHVNGDPIDNRIRNLIPMCVDCHRKATYPGI
jgi:HNH endonuclease